MALGKGAKAIHQSGRWYTDENIDGLLMERHMAKVARRNSKNHLKGPAKRTEADDRRFDSLLEGLHGLEGEDVRAVETRFGPGRRYPDFHTSVSMVLPHRTTNEIVEVRTYHTTPWYSCYPSLRTVYAGFDESGRLRLVDFDD